LKKDVSIYRSDELVDNLHDMEDRMCQKYTILSW